MSLLDNIVAYKILRLLVTPWEETDAFKLGIIDEKGKLLRGKKDLKTTQEREALNIFKRMIFNLKRIIEKIPGGQTRLGSLTAAYFLIKEHMHREDEVPYDVLEEQFNEIVTMDSMLVEETVEILKFLEEMEKEVIGEEDSGVLANITGAAVSTDEPVVQPRKRRKRLQEI